MSEITAIISDIHANREALAAVFEAILEMDPSHVVCLGDIVGYGPEPEWCIDAVRGVCDVVVCGNHEIALLHGARNFSPAAAGSIESQRRRLSPGSGAGAEEGEERWRYLQRLPVREYLDDMLFVHASPANPIYEYLWEKDTQSGGCRKLQKNFKYVTGIAFHGHTHKPGIIAEDYEFWNPASHDEAFTFSGAEKLIVDCGSVGAPRDGDPRACFVTIEDSAVIRYHRVRYETGVTVEKIRKDASCDPAMAAMLSGGAET